MTPHVEFDALTHTYTAGGKRLPSVTQILRANNLPDLSHIPPDVLAAAGKFGQHVHAATELYDAGTLDELALDAALLPYLSGWKTFLDDFKAEVIQSERLVVSEKWQYAGTLDRILMVEGAFWVIDIKSTAADSPVTELQTAAYATANEEMEYSKIHKRGSVRLDPTAPRGYKFTPHESRNDFNVFLSCLNICRWKERANLLPKEKIEDGNDDSDSR